MTAARTIVRLTEKHPLHRKLDKLFQRMEDLEISIETDRHGRVFVYSGDEKAQLLDNEQVLDGYNESFGEFPPKFEWKLVKEK